MPTSRLPGLGPRASLLCGDAGGETRAPAPRTSCGDQCVLLPQSQAGLSLHSPQAGNVFKLLGFYLESVRILHSPPGYICVFPHT